MTTLAEARQAIYDRWVANWTSTPYLFDNEEDEDGLDSGDVPWARVAVREIGGGRETIAPVPLRKYRRNAITFVQLYTPINSGKQTASDLAHTARTLFEGVSFNGLDFEDCQVRDGLLTGRWEQTLVEASFDYEEVK